MRRFWWGLAAVVLVGAVGVGGPSSVSAQAAPVLAASPLRVDPGQPVTFTVSGCPQQPDVTAIEFDMAFVVEMAAGATTGTWTGQLEAGQVDWSIGATCGDEELDRVRLDIDNPLIGFQPIGSMLAPDDAPSTVYGSDCPDGTEARVRFDDFDYGRPAAVSTTTVTSPIDERGDWQVDVPEYLLYGVAVDPSPPPGTVLRERTVTASCGDVAYEVLRIPVQVAGDDDGAPPPDAPQPSAPPPARPVPGRADFTG